MISIRKETINPVKDLSIEQKNNWWSEGDSTLASAQAWQSSQNILLYQQTRMQDLYNFALMYGAKGLGYSTLNTYNNWSQQQRGVTTRDNRLKLNAAKSCVETAQAKIAKNKPRAYFLTEGGTYEQKQRSELLTQYIDGLFDEQNTYQVAQDVFRDAAIFGTGCLYLYSKDDKIYNKKIFIEDVRVDEIEAQYGKPRTIYYTRLMHRDELLSFYPESADLIKNAAAVEYQLADSKDMIPVESAWHLPVNEKTPGRYLVYLKEGCLDDQPYTKDYFPFVFFRWQEGLRSFYGTGIIEQLFSTQLEINQLCATIQQSIYFASVPRVFLSNESKVIAQHLNNKVGSIVKYQGNKPPVFSTPAAQNAEVYNYLDYLWRKCFEQVGLSELSATSQKPTGLDSAVALREYSDIESQRFAIIGQNWETFFLDAANIIVDMSKDLYEAGNKSLKVKVKKGNLVQEIKWKDVQSSADEYILRCFPTSILPTQPAGKLQFVQELIAGGFVSKEEGLSLLDFPDLKSITSLKNSAIDNIQKVFENILDSNIYYSPEPFQNLQEAITLGQGAYLKARNEDVSEEKLELMRRFIEDCHSLIQVNQPQAPSATAPSAPEMQPSNPEVPPI